jgi:hypothetical protein
MGHPTRHLNKMRVWYGKKHVTPTELPKLLIFMYERRSPVSVCKSKCYRSSKILVKGNLKLKLKQTSNSDNYVIINYNKFYLYF